MSYGRDDMGWHGPQTWAEAYDEKWQRIEDEPETFFYEELSDSAEFQEEIADHLAAMWKLRNDGEARAKLERGLMATILARVERACEAEGENI